MTKCRDYLNRWAIVLFSVLLLMLTGCSGRSLSADRLEVDPDQFNVNNDSLDLVHDDRFNVNDDSLDLVDDDRFNVDDDQLDLETEVD